ncbi:hypothetical protein ASC93_19085 [Massilia sp. Root335]|nr:hypothetical protein ASC93_19085 [Massilia sp. Root335]
MASWPRQATAATSVSPRGASAVTRCSRSANIVRACSASTRKASRPSLAAVSCPPDQFSKRTSELRVASMPSTSKAL